MGRPGRVSIDNVKTQVGGLQGSFGARNSFALEVAGRRSQAGGIEQPNRHAAEIDHFLDGIARRAMGFTYDDTVVSEESIKQTRLSRVGRAVNDNANAFAQDAALVGRGEQVGDFAPNRIKSCA